MTVEIEDLIKKAYSAFNQRNMDEALSTLQPNVPWSKAWEASYIGRHHEIREHWTRQWKEINRNGEPVGFNQRQNGSLEVEVHQKVKTYKATLCLMEE